MYILNVRIFAYIVCSTFRTFALCTYILGAENYFPSDFELANRRITRMSLTYELSASFWDAQLIP